MDQHTYIAIDLKAFYASVECVARGLDPLTTNLVVADVTKTEKTICLAVSPSLKAYGIGGRARLFEVIQKLKEINSNRRFTNKGKAFAGKTYDDKVLQERVDYEVDYIAAPPRMALYMQKSLEIYRIYLKYVSEADILVYSIDEVFICADSYLKLYGLSAYDFALRLVKDVLASTGITATVGIGTNLYLAKIAMDILAKKSPPDSLGVRIAFLDEMSYRRKLWSHKPITDFWRIGPGYAAKLACYNMYTMGDVARYSLVNGKHLYKLFGVNAELLIDHAWGIETVDLPTIKAYRPAFNSLSTGQVLTEPYTTDKGRLIVKEMADLLVLDLVAKRLKTDQLVLSIGYDVTNLQEGYKGEVHIDHYGRAVPAPSHGSIRLGKYSSSSHLIIAKFVELYDSIIRERLLIRRINIVANHVLPEAVVPQVIEEIDLFADQKALEAQRQAELKERRCQEAILTIQREFGKNAILKGMNLQEGAKTIERNGQIGGHKA